MDCLLAQQIVSAAADHEPVDAELLAAARDHCSSCAECSRFVRAQIAVAKADLPEPPTDLADRVMAAVRTEAAARAAAEAADLEPAALAAQPEATAGSESTGDRPAPWRGRTVPAVAVITAFAAVVLAVAAGVTVVGSRYLSAPPNVTSRQLTAGQSGASSESKAAPSAVPPAADRATTSTAASPGASVTSPGFITFSGRAYRSQGAASADPSTLHDVGLTTTSLTPNGTASQHALRAGSDPDVVYLADQTGGLVAFKRVGRQFNGQTYYLMSADLTSLATWPALPAKIAVPTSADGSPTFVLAGADAGGARVYRLVTSPNSGGIGIAPGSPASDPAAGNPNWTYWETGP